MAGLSPTCPITIAGIIFRLCRIAINPVTEKLRCYSAHVQNNDANVHHYATLPVCPTLTATEADSPCDILPESFGSNPANGPHDGHTVTNADFVEFTEGSYPPTLLAGFTGISQPRTIAYLTH